MITRINGYPISASFGSIDPSHLIPHKGIDIAMPLGTPVESVGDGIIKAITDEGNRSFGKAVHLQLNDGTEVIYGHLNNFNVRVGEHVHENQLIGFSGSTGDSTGPHLHVQVLANGKIKDPTPYLNHDWSAWEAFTHPKEFLMSIGHDIGREVGTFLMNGFDTIMLLGFCAGLLGIMLSVPKSGKFTAAVFGIYVIVKVLLVVLAA